jgi:hypothetical protein
MSTAAPNAFGFTNPYAPQPASSAQTGLTSGLDDGLASGLASGLNAITSFWTDMMRASLNAFEPAQKKPEPAPAAFNPFSVWADSVNQFITTLTAPPKPTVSPLDPFGVMQAWTTQPALPFFSVPAANPPARLWPWTVIRDALQPGGDAVLGAATPAVATPRMAATGMAATGTDTTITCPAHCVRRISRARAGSSILGLSHRWWPCGRANRHADG